MNVSAYLSHGVLLAAVLAAHVHCTPLFNIVGSSGKGLNEVKDLNAGKSLAFGTKDQINSLKNPMGGVEEVFGKGQNSLKTTPLQPSKATPLEKFDGLIPKGYKKFRNTFAPEQSASKHEALGAPKASEVENPKTGATGTETSPQDARRQPVHKGSTLTKWQPSLAPIPEDVMVEDASRKMIPKATQEGFLKLLDPGVLKDFEKMLKQQDPASNLLRSAKQSEPKLTTNNPDRLTHKPDSTPSVDKLKPISGKLDRVNHPEPLATTNRLKDLPQAAREASRAKPKATGVARLLRLFARLKFQFLKRFFPWLRKNFNV